MNPVPNSERARRAAVVDADGAGEAVGPVGRVLEDLRDGRARRLLLHAPQSLQAGFFRTTRKSATCLDEVGQQADGADEIAERPVEQEREGQGQEEGQVVDDIGEEASAGRTDLVAVEGVDVVVERQGDGVVRRCDGRVQDGRAAEEDEEEEDRDADALGSRGSSICGGGCGACRRAWR